jgi:lipopolysaccharide/colanic/teichoic acid biosynthesis glycosyltransferase
VRPARAKRLLDISIALSLLFALLPVLVVLALAIKLDSRGPIFYRSRRAGVGGGEFAMLKFRKMNKHATGPPLTAAMDERFTRLGSFLARTKLDELPQLWNVIRGDMSLVGPRPEDPNFVRLHPRGYAEILQIQPGVTGLSQLVYVKERDFLNGPNPVQHYVEFLLPQKMAIDRFYVAHRSTILDVRILFWTLAAMFGVEVRLHRVGSRVTIRRRSDDGEGAAPVMVDVSVSPEEVTA